MNTGKFCKICCDTGKSASEYKSHNIRERGVVVCPVLKETVCKYCKTKGHMMSHCVALKEKKGHGGDVKSKTLDVHAHVQQTKTLEAAKRKASLPSNAFAALFLESDDESDVEVEDQSETKTWAHVIADAGACTADACTTGACTTDACTTGACTTDVCATTKACAPMFRMKQYKSWADYSSDSSDDETW